MKTCSLCRRTLPLTAFKPRLMRGRMVVTGRCHGCDLAIRRARRVGVRAAALNAVDREQPIRLEPGPFVDWLRVELDALLDHSDHPTADLAALLDVTPECLRGWLRNRHQCMWLDTIDRALCQAGVPHLLRELYPGLYEERTAA